MKFKKWGPLLSLIGSFVVSNPFSGQVRVHHYGHISNDERE